MGKLCTVTNTEDYILKIKYLMREWAENYDWKDLSSFVKKYCHVDKITGGCIELLCWC